jgi:hypothetical protein
VDSLEGVVREVGQGLQVVIVGRGVVAEAPGQQDLLDNASSVSQRNVFSKGLIFEIILG